MTQELIARLESASEGSRELNIALGQALGLIDSDLVFTEADGSRVKRGNCDPWRDWTDSIDAALALAKRVLPGSGVGLCSVGNGKWEAWIGGRGAYLTSYPTPALALCIALLRASSAEGAGHE